MNTHPLPLVSIITPSFNQGAFLTETIESVLSQDYPYIEHIVVDGGSTDDTLDILHRYAHLGDARFRFVSEPDRGQSHAINKGFRMAGGQIIGWLNSDDTYLPGAISRAVDALLQHPEWGMVYGKGYHIDERGEIIDDFPVRPDDGKGLFDFCFICQPAAFLRKHVIEALGGVDENLDFCMDYDLWIRVSKQYAIGYTDCRLANARLHPGCKSVAHIVRRGYPEIVQTCMKHYGALSNEWLHAFSLSYQPLNVHQFMDLCKQEDVFGQTPRIIEMNRSPAGWVPLHFSLQIACTAENPLAVLLLTGSVPALLQQLDLLVLVNRRPVQRYSLKSGPMELSIPIPAAQSNCLVEILANKQLVNEHGTYSFHVEHVTPLSAEEHLIASAYQQGSDYFSRWLNEHRHPSPAI